MTKIFKKKTIWKIFRIYFVLVLLKIFFDFRLINLKIPYCIFLVLVATDLLQ